MLPKKGVPRLLTPRQVRLFFDIPLGVVSYLLAEGKLATEMKKGQKRILRESVYEHLDNLRRERAA